MFLCFHDQKLTHNQYKSRINDKQTNLNNKDMKECRVIENRGDGIKYVIFAGSEEDCNLWMFYNTKEHPNNPDIRISVLKSDVNSDGEPFTYTIEDED